MASKNKKTEKLNRLLDSVKESILEMSDDEILQEAEEDSINVVEYTKIMKNMIHAEIAESKKAKLHDARKAYDAQSIKSNTDILENMNVPQMLDLLKQAIVGGQVTMAFRDGEGMSENDLRNLIQDLDLLGLMNADNK